MQTWKRSLGKLPSTLLESIIYPKLGFTRPEVIVGPKSGVDVCVIKIATNQVLVAKTDPISLIPKLGPDDSAWMSVNLLANDLSTSGLKPQYMMVDLNLPPKIPNAVLRKYWSSFSGECSRLGIAIAGGHTGKFEGCDYTIVGAATIFSTGSSRLCVTSKGAQVGDKVILTRGAAISATGILAKLFPATIEKKLGSDILQKAARNFASISASPDAIAAAGTGIGTSGVTAMHDVTEGGVLSALFEVAKASNVGMAIAKDQILISEENRAVCTLFKIDPLISLGEGALVITCSPRTATRVLTALRHRSTPANIVGEIVESSSGVRLVGGNKVGLIKDTFADPYWAAYSRAVEKGLD